MSRDTKSSIGIGECNCLMLPVLVQCSACEDSSWRSDTRMTAQRSQSKPSQANGVRDAMASAA
eukprot:6180184-Pleurochrysis_carterae.AAC.2